jgi:maleate cis-trans isomerase
MDTTPMAREPPLNHIRRARVRDRALEMDIGKPVVTHNCAAAGHALRMARVRPPIREYDRLLTLF